MRYHARDMAVVRARGADIPIVLASATPSVETEVNARRGRYRRLHLPERFGGQHLPAIEAIDLRARRPAARAFHRAAARRRGQDRARARRAGAAVPQPARLCAAHALPAMRLPPRLPELRRLAGRPPLPAPSRLPPLRLRDAAAGAMLRTARPSTRSSRSAPGVERLERGGRRAVSRQPHPGAVQRPGRIDGAPARGAGRRRRGPLRHHHRHPAGRQGSPFSQAQPGRRRRCRSRSQQRRSARGRAHVSIAASGRRPRRARGRPRRRLPADASARASGDAGADRGRPRGVLRRARSSCARRPTIRRSGGSRACWCRLASGRQPRAMRAGSPRWRRGRTRCACSGPPRRRLRWCAGATAFGCC